VNCCSLAADPALRMPFQKISISEWQKIFISADLLESPALASSFEPLQFSSSIPPESPGQSFAVLRL